MSDRKRHAALSVSDVESLREEQDVTRWTEAGAPSPMEMWRQLDGVPHKDTAPLTVQQAAQRMNVSTKWIRRRLPALEAMDPPGAYRTAEGSRAPWRIIPAALDRLREQTVEPKPAPPPRGRRKPPAPKKRSGTRWEA